MYVFGFICICMYGMFRAYLDSLQAKNIDDIDQQLREINDSLCSIKMRMKHEKDDSMRK